MVDLLDDPGLLAAPAKPGAVPLVSMAKVAATDAAGATCALCGVRPARDRCTACGRGACAADLWVMLRLCRACASDTDVERGQRGARPAERNWLQGP